MNNSVDDKSELEADKAKKTSDRVKRMRGWLGIKSAVETHNLGGSSEPLIEVDAPNGWNR